jgi:LEA14-like dessication related protein
MADARGLSRARRGVVFGACLAGLLLASGCSLVPQLETPRLSVISLRMQSADLFSQRMQVRMRVLNPNARELPIKGISYRIEVNGAELGQGMTGTPFVVPALGEAEFDVQVTTNLAGTLARLLARRESTN